MRSCFAMASVRASAVSAGQRCSGRLSGNRQARTRGTAKPDHSDGRKVIYSLTAQGIHLAAVLTEMVLWAARHKRAENWALIRLMRKDTKQVNAEIRQRWASQGSHPGPIKIDNS